MRPSSFPGQKKPNTTPHTNFLKSRNKNTHISQNQESLKKKIKKKRNPHQPMKQFGGCCKSVHLNNVGEQIHSRISILRRCFLRVWGQILLCAVGGHVQYRMLPHPPPNCAMSPISLPPPSTTNSASSILNRDEDLVPLKISLLGDSQTGKTSFLAKYVGSGKEVGRWHKNGFNLMDKTLMVKGARISYSLWEVDGDEDQSYQQIPLACKDSVAILIMFDLTSRVTLNGWYQEARKWNQTAIPILVGTKFDDFIQLPLEMQWAVASQARVYAKALNATLFFSSANYNINVNKIFKFITAKIFDAKWTLKRNLTIGEPIIDF